MTVYDGFFNAVDDDRLYDASVFNEVFDGVITPGIIMNAEDSLFVVPNQDMSVKVRPGKAWFNNSWIKNDSEFVVALEPSIPTLSRIDAIVLDFDKRDEVRANRIFVVSGEYATSPLPPVLINEQFHEQHELAHVLIGPGVVAIGQEDITNKIGDTTPIMTGLLETINSDVLLAGWNAEFYAWFNNLQNELDENQVTNLQAQIDALEARPLPGRNLLVNGEMLVKQRTTPVDSLSTYDGYLSLPDRWRLKLSNAGVWRTNDFFNVLPTDKDWCAMHLQTGFEFYETPPPSAQAYLSQRIEGSKLKNLMKGTADAKWLTLSFTVRTHNGAGQYTVEVQDIANNRHVAKNYNVVASDANQRVVLVFPRDTVGPITNDNNAALSINFWFTSGTNYSSGAIPDVWLPQTDSRRAAGQGFYALTDLGSYCFAITDVQLELGDIVTDVETFTYEETLQKCRRYYEVYSGVGRMSALSTTKAHILGHRYFTQKRNTPTISGLSMTRTDFSSTWPGTGVLEHTVTDTEMSVSATFSGLSVGFSYPVLYSYISDSEI